MARAALSVVASLLALAATTSAQTPSQALPPSIQVTGEATLNAPPDRATVDIAVVTRGVSAQRAAATNGEETGRVIGELKKRLGSAATITTIGYSVQTEYRYPGEGRKPEVAGYVAANTVRVVTPDLDRVGDLIDAAVAAGANQVQQVRFTLQNEEKVYADALRQAAARARVEAETLAAALGLKIVRVLTVVEEGMPVRPMLDTFRSVAAAPDSAPTPMEPGTIEVHARVALTVEVAGGP
jgi:uncharacterized protein YggE